MKISKLGIAAAVVLVVGLGWYFFANQEQSPRTSTSSETIYSDSIDAPDRPVITAQKDTTPRPEGEGLEPGTVLVRITVLNVDSHEKLPKAMAIRIEEVKAYGPSTSPISSNSELTVDVEHIVKKDEALLKQLKEGSELLAVISAREGMETGESGEEVQWTLIELKRQ